MGPPKSYKNNSVSHLCHSDSKVFWNCGWGGGIGGAKILQNGNGAPSLSVIKIVKYCGVRGGGGHCGRQNLTKIIASLISVIKIITYFTIVGGALRGAKILQKIMAPPFSVIKIVKYCGIAWVGAIILQKIMAPPSHCH